MKGDIDTSGILRIQRNGRMLLQKCVHNRDNFCMNTCPAFREPEQMVLKQDSDGVTQTNITRLQLCNEVGELYFEEFSDNRGEIGRAHV